MIEGMNFSEETKRSDGKSSVKLRQKYGVFGLLIFLFVIFLVLFLCSGGVFNYFNNDVSLLLSESQVNAANNNIDSSRHVVLSNLFVSVSDEENDTLISVSGKVANYTGKTVNAGDLPVLSNTDKTVDIPKTIYVNGSSASLPSGGVGFFVYEGRITHDLPREFTFSDKSELCVWDEDVADILVEKLKALDAERFERQKAEEEQRRVEEEEKQRAEEERQRQAEEEQRKLEEEQQRQAAEEAERLRAEEEQRAEAERFQREAEARRAEKAAEEERQRAEAEAERQRREAEVSAERQRIAEEREAARQEAVANGTVCYIAPQSGKCYHFDPNCYGLRNANSVVERIVEELGGAYRPCKLCAGG